LKQVKNLEELINFKVKTVGKDIAVEESHFMRGIISSKER